MVADSFDTVPIRNAGATSSVPTVRATQSSLDRRMSASISSLVPPPVSISTLSAAYPGTTGTSSPYMRNDGVYDCVRGLFFKPAPDASSWILPSGATSCVASDGHCLGTVIAPSASQILLLLELAARRLR